MKVVEQQSAPLTSLCGLWKGHGISISAEDIAEARKDMWSGT